ncbi:Asp-tRNA(Asn)/Glu-tRNA(Gln) amidotransferase subunit GatA [Micrococcus porci]|uniref:Asp-tRNA(Asn)/Glu-tRNA(Gln) amidotransferase subunit GatA n=1 Tax=Micrococcus TaxID=1269 RepID=UPI001CCB3377|nr:MULTISPECIES: Asp-tRNA(Asn)/Glu-tRNA(Gln) amidotransferase subunit GatA [Micrococcus]MCG7423102.1 Asp-tRNA(Asn)/Glu-tRNA(Gln) amidotransferase subunit GatA [Micrococcus sp. ACRRV]UBH24441.1 Asp-tRNA(Asn)/Glu-tRNA(Gln) amidotransferase subunit GatA [Micrococcus porci]
MTQTFDVNASLSADELVRLTALQMAERLRAGTTTSVELVQAHLDRIAAVDGDPRSDAASDAGVRAYLHVNTEEALAVAAEVDAIRAAGGAEAEALHPLAGVPVALKDNIVTVGQPTTAASKMLDGWMSPYDATVVERIRAAKLPILGKTNMDEFAMGGSTEYSAFGVTRNPWDGQRVPGGSGGGSAAAVAGFLAPFALGSDTGGSIREPAAFTGTVGVKPTYGAVSRYGVIAMASSLDQVGPAARTVADAAALQQVIGGHDAHDSTSLPEEQADLVAAAAGRDLAGLKVGVVTDLDAEGFHPGVKAAFDADVQALRDAGAEIVEVSCPHFAAALGAYYLIMPSEVSSNLARFDGVRYGHRVVPDGGGTIEQVMAASRAAGFGGEVKRRIILGTYALSAGYYDAYYGSAQKVRTLVQQDFAAAFEQVDVLLTPTAPIPAFRLGEQTKDPLTMYLNDLFTIPANLAGVPGISVPGGLVDGLPYGLQFMAPAREDARLYEVGAAVEKLVTEREGGPLWARVPEQHPGAARAAQTPAGGTK